MHRLTISADGAPGAHGAPGFDGHDGGRGQDGRDGGPAGSATPGLPAGMISLVLTDRMNGEYAYHLDGHLNGQEREQAVSPNTDLLLLARGGRGGNGGHGGNGGDGGRGRSGSDATRYSSGSNGGRGGDGGNGGYGTHGAPGGAGGQIVLRVTERSAYLLMAVEQSEGPAGLVAGGDGGDAGRHGRGGSGGRGGPGGSSYSWTETESYTDAQGNRATRTKRHSNSGGSTGPSGSSGSTPHLRLNDGADGQDGQFLIEVMQGPSVLGAFGRRFDLRLESFDFAEEQTDTWDGVLEFGEVVEVTNLLFRNVGGMPTPPHQRVRVTLDQRRWLQPLETELFIAQALQPNETILLQDVLRFRIPRPHIVDPADPRVETEVIPPIADQLGPERPNEPAAATAFQRRYRNVNFTRGFEARFPLENTDDIRVLQSLAPGEQSRIVFNVDNISQKDLGTQSAIGRRVHIQLEQTSGDIGPEQLTFVDQDGVEYVLHDTARHDSGFYINVPLIEAGGFFTVEGSIGFRKDVPPYVGADLTFTIWLESLALDGALEVVQRRRVTLRAEPGYAASDDSRILLLTHNNVSRDAYLAWNTLLDEKLELPADDWSMARYGHFDHEQILPDGMNLRGHLEDKLVIVLNNHFNPRSTGEEELPSNYVRGKDFRESVTQSGTRYLIVGADEFAMQQWLEPNSVLRAGGDDYTDMGDYLNKESRSAGTLSEDMFREDITTVFDTLRVETLYWPWGTPTILRLQKFARKLQMKLSRLHPHRRYIVIYREATPERLGRPWGFMTRWYVGDIEIRRSLNLETSTAILLRASDGQMNNPEFLHGASMRFALLLSLSFETKLQRLNWLLQSGSELDPDRKMTARCLVQALLVDVAEEQVALRSARGSLTDEVLEQKLSYLVRLRDEPLMTMVDDDSNKWDVLFDLSAGLEAIAHSQKPWWALWGRQKRISKFTLDVVEKFNYENFARYAIDVDGDVAMGIARAREAIEPRVKRIQAHFKALFSWWQRLWSTRLSRAIAMRYFQHPLAISENVQREVDAWTDPGSRVWNVDAFERAQLAEAQRTEHQAQLKAQNTADRAAMLTQEVGEEQERLASMAIEATETVEVAVVAAAP